MGSIFAMVVAMAVAVVLVAYGWYMGSSFVRQRELWIVGRCIGMTSSGMVWEFQGAFDERMDALRACRTQDYFMGPAQLNEVLPHASLEWPRSEFPLALYGPEELGK